jgi:SAM-dependent methyltransferase
MPWDKGHPAPPLVEWIEARPGLLQGRILVPGSGRGHDVRALAALPGVSGVTGLDVSPSAVNLANQVPRAGVEEHRVGDLFDLPAEDRGAYDWVWEHTCFCAIDPARRDEYVRAVHGALKPGGGFLAVFYLDPYDDEHRPGGGPPHGSSLEELESRFVEPGLFVIAESYVPSRSYPGREGLERVIRMARV